MYWAMMGRVLHSNQQSMKVLFTKYYTLNEFMKFLTCKSFRLHDVLQSLAFIVYRVYFRGGQGGGQKPPPPMKVFAPLQELVELTY